MQCPKCGHRQEGDFECFRCGIIFHKFQPEAAVSASSGGIMPRITLPDGAIERKRSLQLVALLVLLAIVLHEAFTGGPITHPPGILAPTAPEQVNLTQQPAWRRGNRVIVGLASFQAKGRVLGTERYRWDATSDLSPIDIVLGWGAMSDQRIVDSLDIVQGSRRAMIVPMNGTPPLPWPVLLASSSNMHMIPADSDVEDRLKALRCGQIIRLKGFLVGVRENGEWVWVSSGSRTDTGDGACEIVWVQSLEVE